jgi:hypothetical protein
MAKGTKTAYTSQGKHSNVSSATRTLMKRGTSEGERMINKQKAWADGKNPWMTIPNPNKTETNKRFIKVRMNDLMGNPKDNAKKSIIF